jgi:hypothetical protein
VYIDNEQEGYGSSDGATVQHPTMNTSFPWHKIWALQCPNKVKTFAWSLAHNNLPLKRRIESRGIELDTKCLMCWRFDEDTGHLFFMCKFARGVWQQLQMEEMRKKLCKLCSGYGVFHAIWECTTTMQTKLITTLWILWSERNAVNAGVRKTSADKMSYQILRHINEFQEFCTNKNDKSVQKLEYWKRPADCYLKINIDGAFIQQTHQVAGDSSLGIPMEIMLDQGQDTLLQYQKHLLQKVRRVSMRFSMPWMQVSRRWKLKRIASL